MDVPQFVNTGFVVLFTPPPGVLFHLPSQYYALSVTKEYLAWGGWSPDFLQGFTCLAVLGSHSSLLVSRTGLHPLWLAFPRPFDPNNHLLQCEPRNAGQSGLGLFPIRSPLLRKSMFLSLPPAT